MGHQNLINICVFEQFEGLLFSDLSGPLTSKIKLTKTSTFAKNDPQRTPLIRLVIQAVYIMANAR